MGTPIESKQVKLIPEMIKICVFTLFFCSIAGKHFLIKTEELDQDYNDEEVQQSEGYLGWNKNGWKKKGFPIIDIDKVIVDPNDCLEAPKVSGKCWAYIPSWSYDNGQCEEFIY